MKPDAVIQARARLRKANTALRHMKAAKAPKTIEGHWGDFLIAAGGVYAKLEAGAEGPGKSSAWYGRVKHVRRKDELLRYIHHARNTEEHGLQVITGRSNSHVGLSPGAVVTFIAKDKHSWDAIAHVGTITYPNDVVTLVRVFDAKHGDWFEPPTSHLGNDIADRSAVGVAALAVAYLESLIDKAATL
jgi:hypothetical protein